MRERVAFYTHHEAIDFSVISEKEYDDTSSSYYLAALYKYLKIKGIELVNLQSLDSNDQISFCIFIDTIDPHVLLKRFGVTIPNLILIQRECNVIAPKLWIKGTLDLYDIVVTYNLDFCKSIGTRAKLIKSLMPQYINLKLSRFLSLKERKFVMISSNKVKYHDQELYSLRSDLVRWFETHKAEDLDLYGADWDRILVRKPIYLRMLTRKIWFPRKLKTLKGYATHKLDTIAKYDFCFCIENTKNFDGYISEKIFDAMMAGSIPIYYGPPNIREYIPDDTYIAMQNFTNFSDLYSFCMSMTKAEKSKYRESIKSFLQKGIGPFSTESFNNSLHKILSNE